MKMQLAMLGVAAMLVGGCRDRHDAAPTPAPVTHAYGAPVAQPMLPAAVSSVIDNLADAPPEARERLEELVAAIDHDHRADALAMVSSGGFVTGELSLIAEQVKVELDGRTVAELTEVPCGPSSVLGACHWVVSARGARELELAARVNGDAVAAIDMVREDDGSWAIARGHRLTARVP